MSGNRCSIAVSSAEPMPRRCSVGSTLRRHTSQTLSVTTPRTDPASRPSTMAFSTTCSRSAAAPSRASRPAAGSSSRRSAALPMRRPASAARGSPRRRRARRRRCRTWPLSVDRTSSNAATYRRSVRRDPPRPGLAAGWRLVWCSRRCWSTLLAMAVRRSGSSCPPHRSTNRHTVSGSLLDEVTDGDDGLPAVVDRAIGRWLARQEPLGATDGLLEGPPLTACVTPSPWPGRGGAANRCATGCRPARARR